MHQRQSGSPKRQQRRLPIRFFTRGGNQQIQGRNAHRPAAQQRALGNHQVRNDVGKTQIEVGLIGRRSVIPGENLANAGKIVRKRQIKIIEKTESPIQKEQQRRDRDRLVPPAEQLLRQQHIARIGQRHQQRARHDERQVQRHAEHVKRRAQRVGQIRIGKRRPRQQIVSRRKAHVFQRRDKRQMHAQIAVGGLAAPERPVRRGHDAVGVLQIGRERRQRKAHGGHHGQLPPVRFPHGAQRRFFPRGITNRRQQQRRGDGRDVRGEREIQQIGAERRKAHFHQHAQ